MGARDDVSLGEPLLNADGKPPGGLSLWFIWAVSRGSVLNHLNRKRPLCSPLTLSLGV